MKKGDILVCIEDHYKSFPKGLYKIYDLSYTGHNTIDDNKVFLLQDDMYITSVDLKVPVNTDGNIDFKGFYAGESYQEIFITLEEFKYRNRAKKLDMLDESL